MSVLTIAKRYHDSGFAVLPLHTDGSKATIIGWAEYPWYRLERYFSSLGNPSGIGILCGRRSRNLEVLDYDHKEAFPEWSNLIDPTLLKRLVLVATPSGGMHVWYRCPIIDHNLILAQYPDYNDLDKDGNPKPTIYIETRGEGGMVVATGSPLSVHPTHKPYRLVQGNPSNPPIITPEQRAGMHDAARSLNRYIKHKKPARKTTMIINKGERIGDKFNATATWQEILEPAGWEIERTKGSLIYWRKPNSLRGNHHATTGYGDSDTLYCFSTDAPPFDHETAYNKFASYTLLYCDGDYRKAANHLIHNYSMEETNDHETKAE